MRVPLRVFAAKLQGLFGQPKADGEFDEEVREHLQLLTDRFLHQGMSYPEAAAAARRQFGNTTVLQQKQREMRTPQMLATVGRDLRYGVRQLRRNPLFTLIAILSLVLGIGANTAIFTVAKKVLFDTLPVQKPQELRMLTWVSGHERLVPPVWGDVGATKDGGLTSNAFSYPVLEELRKRTNVVADLIAFKDLYQATATVDGQAELVNAEMVSGNAFQALGVKPILGRPLMPADDAGPGKGPVAVISEGYWAERFGRSKSVLGKTILVNGIPITIVGVSPARFTSLKMGSAAQIFVPLTMQPLLAPRAQEGTTSLLDNPQSWWVLILARLRPDVPEAQAQAALDVALRQAAMATLPKAANTSQFNQFHLKLEPGDRGLDYLKGDFAESSYVLLALAGLVLLLACVNLANLLLARAASREREMSTRMALGAGRMRILRQMLTESLLLSGLGGAGGLALGYLGRNVIPRLLENSWSADTLRLDFDWRVVAFTVGISLATGIFFGIAPAWQAMRSEGNTALKEANHGTVAQRTMWLGKGLVVFQIALSTILLIGAGLFVRTLVNLSHTPLGFRADHILLFELNPPRTRYTDAQMVQLYRQLEEKIVAIAGVRSVSMSDIAIVGDGYSGSTFHVSGRPVHKDEPRVQLNLVGEDFFQTMGIAVLQGRGFNAQDTATSPKVAVINRTLARKYFPNENPIGQTFVSEDATGLVQVVGITADTRYANLRSETPPLFYMPYEQTMDAGRMVVEVRTAAGPGSVLSQVRAAVASLDRDLPLIGVRTMTEQIQASMSGERVFAQLTSGFGLLALVLAIIGIYGIMAYTVARRTNEIGIRMALGARAEQVLGMVLREALWMAIVGVVLGVGVAVWLARLVSAMLYGLKPSDPLTLAGAAVLLLCIALLAAFGPARQASRVDPMRALRHE
ncbi:MAG TPA: ABC transporter permease [Acidobacteriaceae bacterium]|jgi:predicted permease|nr:ABC transporter permease [Acidobacteriaceae bacterium]